MHSIIFNMLVYFFWTLSICLQHLNALKLNALNAFYAADKWKKCAEKANKLNYHNWMHVSIAMVAS